MPTESMASLRWRSAQWRADLEDERARALVNHNQHWTDSLCGPSRLLWMLLPCLDQAVCLPSLHPRPPPRCQQTLQSTVLLALQVRCQCAVTLCGLTMRRRLSPRTGVQHLFCLCLMVVVHAWFGLSCYSMECRGLKCQSVTSTRLNAPFSIAAFRCQARLCLAT